MHTALLLVVFFEGVVPVELPAETGGVTGHKTKQHAVETGGIIKGHTMWVSTSL
jgi:hypothetical protein